METEGLDFAGALESLADRYGVQLEREAEDPREAARREARDRLLALLERTAAYYVRVLWESAEAAPAREYLAGRGLEEGALREFRVGFSPSAFDRVVAASARMCTPRAGKIAATVDKDLAISGVAAALESGKAYSYYLSGFYNTTAKTVDAFIVEDNFVPEIDYTVAYVRFVHAISNANSMTLYAWHTVDSVESALGGEVAYMSAGAFTALPAGVYDLITRYPGASTDVIKRTGVSFLAGRVYTIAARGSVTGTPTSTTGCPGTTTTCLDNTANR